MYRIAWAVLLWLAAVPAGWSQIGRSHPMGKTVVGLATSRIGQRTLGKTSLPQCPLRLRCDAPPAGCPVYVFLGTGDWRLPTNWEDERMPPKDLPSCYQIIINPVGSEVCILPTPQTVQPGSQLVVMPGKTLIVPGQLKIQ